MLIPNYTNSTIEIATNERINKTPHLQAIQKFKTKTAIEFFEYIKNEESELKDAIVKVAIEFYLKDYNLIRIRNVLRTRFCRKISHRDLKQMLFDNSEEFRQNGFSIADYLSVKAKVKKLQRWGLSKDIILHKCFITHNLKKETFEQILQELEQEKIDN